MGENAEDVAGLTKARLSEQDVLPFDEVAEEPGRQTPSACTFTGIAGQRSGGEDTSRGGETMCTQLHESREKSFSNTEVSSVKCVNLLLLRRHHEETPAVHRLAA